MDDYCYEIIWLENSMELKCRLCGDQFVLSDGDTITCQCDTAWNYECKLVITPAAAKES